MPVAAARKRHHSSSEDYPHAPPHRSAHQPGHQPVHPGHTHQGQGHPAQTSRSKSSVLTTPARSKYTPHDNPTAPQTDTTQDESFLEHSERARAQRRARRRAHRPLRLSWSACFGLVVVMGQLVTLLWLQGLTLSARNRSYTLDKDIAAVQEDVSRTQKEIAALDSSPHIARWARVRGWTVATQDKLDPVTINGQAPASGGANASSTPQDMIRGDDAP